MEAQVNVTETEPQPMDSDSSGTHKIFFFALLYSLLVATTLIPNFEFNNI